jgi:hypothetical protein
MTGQHIRSGNVEDIKLQKLFDKSQLVKGLLKSIEVEEITDIDINSFEGKILPSLISFISNALQIDYNEINKKGLSEAAKGALIKIKYIAKEIASLQNADIKTEDGLRRVNNSFLKIEKNALQLNIKDDEIFIEPIFRQISNLLKLFRKSDSIKLESYNKNMKLQKIHYHRYLEKIIYKLINKKGGVENYLDIIAEFMDDTLMKYGKFYSIIKRISVVKEVKNVLQLKQIIEDIGDLYEILDIQIKIINKCIYMGNNSIFNINKGLYNNLKYFENENKITDKDFLKQSKIRNSIKHNTYIIRQGENEVLFKDVKNGFMTFKYEQIIDLKNYVFNIVTLTQNYLMLYPSFVVLNVINRNIGEYLKNELKGNK